VIELDSLAAMAQVNPLWRKFWQARLSLQVVASIAPARLVISHKILAPVKIKELR
jgi:hypothetical protein